MRKLDWCLKKEDRLKKISPNTQQSTNHLHKAKHNLKAAQYSKQGGYTDWTVSQAYYALYHALLALLYKHGYESKNHSCTLAAIQHLIDTNNISLQDTDILFIQSTQQQIPTDAKSLREAFQYGTQTSANKHILNELLTHTKQLLEQIELELL
jgi:uncharacterized protein (UPF0332 family)